MPPDPLVIAQESLSTFATTQVDGEKDLSSLYPTVGANPKGGIALGISANSPNRSLWDKCSLFVSRTPFGLPTSSANTEWDFATVFHRFDMKRSKKACAPSRQRPSNSGRRFTCRESAAGLPVASGRKSNESSAKNWSRPVLLSRFMICRSIGSPSRRCRCAVVLRNRSYSQQLVGTGTGAANQLPPV